MQLSDYVDKIYFFCLKRCNNIMDAEDLSQTILTEAYISINKAKKIENLEKYIFQIAYNQYSKYIDGIVKKRDLIDSRLEIEQIGIIDSNLDQLIEDEKFRELNFQLKLLSSDYINIVYSYYVEDMKLSEIAIRNNLPLGTVKRKLFEIRNKLKEKFKMEKLNGKKTYIPQNYWFSKMSSNTGTYDPHDYVTTLIQKNLLYHSYDNPCTLEDYAIELGISMPYIEDLIGTLEKVTLIKKIDNKYVTNFAFLSKEIREKLYDKLGSYEDSFIRNLLNLARDSMSEFKKIGFSNAFKDEKKLLWNYIMILLLRINKKSKINSKYTKRPGDGSWDFLGFETMTKKLDLFFVGFNYLNTYEYIGHTFHLTHPQLKDRLPNSDYYFPTIQQLYKLNITKYSALEGYKDNVDELIKDGLITIENDEIKYNCMVFRAEEYEKLEELLNQLNLEPLIEEYNNIYTDLVEKIKGYLPIYLASQADFIAFSMISDLRGFTYVSAEKQNLLDFCLEDKVFIYNFYLIIN